MTVMTMPCLGGFPGKQGLMKKKVRNLFRKLRPVIRGQQEVGETLMKDLIDGMNEIEKPQP